MIMTLIISAIATLRGIGFAPEYFRVWIEAWLLSWLVAYPVMLFVLPITRNIVAKLVEPPSR